MADFHKLRIADIYKETADTAVLTFEVPEDLHETFKFRQGQHLTLKALIDGEDVRRSYSLCTSPSESVWQVAVKQIPEGKFSTFINEALEIGDHLEVMEPSGNFGVNCSQDQGKNYLFFAAASPPSMNALIVDFQSVAVPLRTGAEMQAGFCKKLNFDHSFVTRFGLFSPDR